MPKKKKLTYNSVLDNRDTHRRYERACVKIGAVVQRPVRGPAFSRSADGRRAD
jgi:hypothetical protein